MAWVLARRLEIEFKQGELQLLFDPLVVLLNHLLEYAVGNTVDRFDIRSHWLLQHGRG